MNSLKEFLENIPLDDLYIYASVASIILLIVFYIISKIISKYSNNSKELSKSWGIRVPLAVALSPWIGFAITLVWNIFTTQNLESMGETRGGFTTIFNFLGATIFSFLVLLMVTRLTAQIVLGMITVTLYILLIIFLSLVT